MKIVYCANCGTRLNISRKALPQYGRIIDVVEFHECPEEPVELDLTPVDVPMFVREDKKDKFVQKLDELAPKSILGAIGTGDLRDRRIEEPQKSTAPKSLQDGFKNLSNTIADKDMEDLD